MPFKTYWPSKADQARAVAAQLKAEGKPVRPKTVLEMLEKRGVIMDAGHCTKITHEYRKPQKRRCARKAAANRAPAHGKAINGHKGAPTGDYASLILASQFAKRCGGIEKAKKTLTELAQIVDAVREVVTYS